MVSTRSKDKAVSAAGEKREASEVKSKAGKKQKLQKEKDGELEVGQDGQVGLKDERERDGEEGTKKEGEEGVEGVGEQREEKNRNAKEAEGDHAEGRTRSGPGETKQENDEIDTKARHQSPGSQLEEPKHGTLESGHIYFLYRPKIDAEEVDSVDDISKFHILLIPKSSPYEKGHYHRIIEVGKKKLPDPHAKRQVIWGLVGGVGTDPAALKDAFGAYSYETKTRGTRHQPPARPAARGYYILHSPRDELADDPNRNRQRDFKTLLAYEITTPAHDDFGNVQEELGIAEKGAIVLQVKDPNAADNNNPRAANMPREKKAHFPDHLQSLFENRRWIPANPPTLLNYQGAEVLILTSPHELDESLGKHGDQVEEDLDAAAKKEQVDTQGALNELGMSKKDTEIEALEGHWA